MEKLTEGSLRLKEDITKQIFMIGSSPAPSQTLKDGVDMDLRV